MSNEGDGGELDRMEKVLGRIAWTFQSILIFNWILVIMGVVAFGMALFKGYGGEFDLAVLFGALGTADVISVFKFAMDRVQRSLGDQVQVQIAFEGKVEQMKFIKQVKSNTTIHDIEGINEEIRRTTLNSMELIQDFTKIAEPLKEKPWIRALPIRYDPLEIDAEKNEKGEIRIYMGEEITMSGTLRNVSNKPVEINVIVIAVRPPHGTPDGGPFRFDFYVDPEVRTVKAKESCTIKWTKRIEKSATKKNLDEEIPEKYLGKDWYAFMTCQTEDGCWHDDHNKVWFEVAKKKP